MKFTLIGTELWIHLSTNVSVANPTELKGTSGSKECGECPHGSTCSLMQSALLLLVALSLLSRGFCFIDYASRFQIGRGVTHAVASARPM